MTVEYIALEDFVSCGEKVSSGEYLIRFTGCTYGCISHCGIAVTRRSGGPFFEVPENKIREIGRMKHDS